MSAVCVLTDRRQRIAAVVIVAVAVLPMLTAAWALWHSSWTPVADDALIDMRTRDVFSSSFPLVGVYSRFGWNHPGPALFVTLAPFEAVFGTAGLVVGAAVVNSAAIAFALWVLWRRGGLPMTVVGGVAFAVLVAAMGSDVIDPWNAWLSVLPFAATFVAAWGVACGDRVLLPVVVGLASWVVQLHVGYVVLVGVLLIVALTVVGIDARRDRASRRLLAIGGAVAVVIWLPPIYEQVTASDGNLGRMLDAPVRDVVGVDAALGLTARAIGIPQGWLFGHDALNGVLLVVQPSPIARLLLPLVVSAIAAAFVVARATDRPMARDALRFQVLAWAMVVAAIVSASRIQGLAFPYLLRWQWVVAMFVWTSAAWSCVVGARLVERCDGEARLAAVVPKVVRSVGAVVSAAIVLGCAVAVIGDPVPDATISANVASVARSLADVIDSDEQVVIHTEGEFRGEYTNGVAAALDRRGVDVRFPRYLSPHVGSARATGGGGARRVVTISAGASLQERLAAGDVPAVRFDPLDAHERVELDQLTARWNAVVAESSAGREATTQFTDADFRRLQQLYERGTEVGVFIVTRTEP